MKGLRSHLFIVILILTTYCASASRPQIVVTDFGAVGDGTSMCTTALQQAIDAASDKGGGDVIIPSGKYLSGSLLLRDKVNLIIEKDAVLFGSSNPYDYQKLEPEDAPVSPNSADNSKLALLMAYKVHDITISGEGTIDGNGRQLALVIDSLHHIGERVDPKFRNRVSETYRPKIINFMMCDGVRVEGVTIRDAACWVQTYEICTNLTIKDISVESRAYWNNDGMDITDCRNVNISGCDVNSADDGICLKSYYPGYCNDSIYITDCRIVTSASAVKLGTASHGGFRNVNISKIRVKDTYRSAIAIEAVDGGFIDGVYVNDVLAYNTGNGFFIRLGNRRGTASRLRNVKIENMRVQVPYEDADIKYDMKGPRLNFPHNPIPASITGIPGSKVENVVIRNVEIEYPGRASKGIAYIPTWRLESVPEQESRYPEYSMFGELPAWGIYVRHVDGLELDGIRLTHVGPDFRHAVVCDDATNLKFNDLNLRPEDIYIKNTSSEIRSDGNL